MTRFSGPTVPSALAWFTRRRNVSGHAGLRTSHVTRLASATLLLPATLLACLGCRSDLSQQLLERELRMQEDQIYQLQDELQDKCARLDRTAGENSSLRRQLGFNEGDAPARGRGPASPGSPALPPRLPMGAGPGPSQPLLVPPAIDIPAARLPAPTPTAPPPAALPAPGAVAPPTLEGIPPLPAEPRFPGASTQGPFPVTPAAATADSGGEAPTITPTAGIVDSTGQFLAQPATSTAELPADRRLSPEESLAVAGRITHLVINPAQTVCFDGNGDGFSDGLAVVIEPRDGDERLVTAAGDVSITVFDGSGNPGGGSVARWDIPASEAVARFRRTSRNRGLHFVLRWPGPPPQGEHVRVQVRLTTFDATSFETDCTVAARPQPSLAGAD
jgi:hypothetical protein